MERSERRQFVKRMGGVLAGGVVARALPWAAAGGTLFWPRRVHASTVLDPANPGLFQTEGTQLFVPDEGVLTLADTSNADSIVFFAFDTDADAGKDLDVVATFRVIAGVPVNADAGNRIVINDGQARAAIAACIMRDGGAGPAPGIGMYSGGLTHDPDSYPVFVPVDWSAPVTIRLRRWANGDAEIVELNGVAPSPRALLTADRAPAPTRAGATVEFGCASTYSECTVEYNAFYTEPVVLPVGGTISFTRVRIRDSETADRLAFRADCRPGAGSNGLNPATEPVIIQLSTPNCCTFYEQVLNGFTVQGKPGRRRWMLNATERARTGIEQCVFDENRDGTVSVVLRDTRVELADDYFGTLNVAITIGTGASADRWIGTARLVERQPGNGRWHLEREP